MIKFSNGNEPSQDDDAWLLAAKAAQVAWGTMNSVSRIDAATTALAINRNRQAAFIQNLGTNVLYVKKGSGCSTTDFSSVLVGGGSQDDGGGGVFNIGNYKGIVTIAGTSPRYVVVEDTSP